MKNYWIFPALLILFISVGFQTDFHWLAVIIIVYWLLRIIILGNKKVFILSIVLSLLALGNLAVREAKQYSNLELEQTNFIVSVKPTTFSIDGNLLKFDGRIMMEDQSENITVRHYIEIEDEKDLWMKEDLPKFVRIKGALSEPSENTNFNQFNYKKYLFRKNIYYELLADTVENVSYNESLKDRYPTHYKVDYFRTKIFDSIDRNLFGKTADYCKTLLFAGRNSISPETMSVYREVGLVHLLSISGLHIQLLVACLHYIFLRIGVTRESTALILLIVLPIYGFLAGFGTSVFRAIFQSLFRFTFILLDKQNSSLNNWSLTLILNLFLFPSSIYSAGFQLSYLLSGFLILFSNSKRVRALSRGKAALFLNFFISLISIPILTYHFFEFPWLSLMMNIIFVPIFSSLIFPMIILMFISSWFISNFTLFSYFNEMTNILLNFFEEILETLTNFNSLTFVSGRLSLIGMIGLILGILLILLSLEWSKVKKKISLVTGICIFSISLFSTRFSPVGFVMMIDVGQAESIVIKPAMTSKTVMIDTGGSLSWREEEEWEKRSEEFKISTDITIPVLKSFGITSIEMLYLTHGDVDHVGELEDLINNFPVKELSSTEKTLQSVLTKEHVEIINNKDIIVSPIQTLDRNYPLDIPIFVLGPTEVSITDNDNSLVLYSEIGSWRWLFTGDIEDTGERMLVRNFPNLQTDILKVAHHGSQTSTSDEILKILKPKVAWISAGKNNTYGHPSHEVINRLQENNVKILRTDENGALQYQYSPFKFLNNRIEKFKINNTKIDERGE